MKYRRTKREQIIELLGEGVPLAEICQTVDTTLLTVKATASKANISLRKPVTETKKGQILALAAEGLDKRTIAERVGTSLGSVQTTIAVSRHPVPVKRQRVEEKATLPPPARPASPSFISPPTRAQLMAGR